MYFSASLLAFTVPNTDGSHASTSRGLGGLPPSMTSQRSAQPEPWLPSESVAATLRSTAVAKNHEKPVALLTMTRSDFRIYRPHRHGLFISTLAFSHASLTLPTPRMGEGGARETNPLGCRTMKSPLRHDDVISMWEITTGPRQTGRDILAQ